MKALLIICLLTASAAGGFTHLGLIAAYFGLAYIISGKVFKYTFVWWTLFLIVFELLYHGIKIIFQ